MTSEDKELLIRDLSARLPYNVIVHIHDIDVCDYDNHLCEYYLAKFRTNDILIKPYLRPMSDMTEEERKEFDKIKLSYHFDEDGYVLFDWLNKHHFDYRGLIEKGLALVAPEGMYK